MKRIQGLGIIVAMALGAPAWASTAASPKTVSGTAEKAAPAAPKRIHGDYVSSRPSMEVKAGEVIQGDAVSLGGHLHIRGEVTGDATSVGGNVYIYKGAKVGHEVVAVGGKVILEEGADPGCNTQSVNVPFIRPLMRGLASSGIMDVETKGGGSADVSIHMNGKGHVHPQGKEPEESDVEESGDGGDWEFSGRDVSVGKNTVVHGDVNVTKGNVTVDGRVRGGVKVVSGNVAVSGSVGDSIKAVGGDVTLGAKSHVSGSVRLFGGTLHREEGSQVDGSIREHAAGPFGGFFQGWDSDKGSVFPWNVLGAAGKMILWLALSLLAGLVAARPIQAASRFVAGRALASAGTGFASWFALVIVCIALVLTCIGILLVPVACVAFVGLLLLGIFACAYWLGSTLLWSTRPATGERSPYLPLLVGTFIVTLVGFVPGIGPVIKWVGLGSLGAGALLLSRFGRRLPFGADPNASAPHPNS